jgi:hypothetical protein
MPVEDDAQEVELRRGETRPGLNSSITGLLGALIFKTVSIQNLDKNLQKHAMAGDQWIYDLW